MVGRGNFAPPIHSHAPPIKPLHPHARRWKVRGRTHSSTLVPVARYLSSLACCASCQGLSEQQPRTATSPAVQLPPQLCAATSTPADLPVQQPRTATSPAAQLPPQLCAATTTRAALPPPQPCVRHLRTSTPARQPPSLSSVPPLLRNFLHLRYATTSSPAAQPPPPQLRNHLNPSCATTSTPAELPPPPQLRNLLHPSCATTSTPALRDHHLPGGVLRITTQRWSAEAKHLSGIFPSVVFFRGVG